MQKTEEAGNGVCHNPATTGRRPIIWCLHDAAKVQQTSSKCIQNTRANAGRLLKVCWKFVRCLLDRVNTLSSYQKQYAYMSLKNFYLVYLDKRSLWYSPTGRTRLALPLGTVLTWNGELVTGCPAYLTLTV